MHIKLNSNWLSIMYSNSFLNNLESSKKSEKQGILTSLNNGMDTAQISQAAIDAFKSLQESGQSGSTRSKLEKGFTKILQDKLDTLVSSGTLTSEQETAIQDALLPQEKGTPAQYRRHESLDNILDGLISDGVIGEDEKSAIVDALKPPRSGESKPEANGLDKQLKAKLDPLVTAGTIDSDQETVVQDALTSHKKEYPRHHHHGFENTLNSLVVKGTITEEQKDAIIEAINPFANSDTSEEAEA